LRFARLIVLSVLLIATRPVQVWAAPPPCSPFPQVAGSIRLLSPSTYEQPPSNDIAATIAVLPPGQNVAATLIFSAEAQSGRDRVPLWMSVPTPLSGATPIPGLREYESAWSFRIFGAPPHSQVSVFAAHYEYGSTADNPSNPFSLSAGTPTANPANTCRLLVKQRFGTFMTR
jgi:hypothetical protein